MGSHLGCQPAGDFTHWCQQRQAAVLQLHRFVGDRCGACLEQGFSHLRVSRQVQVGEQHHVLTQETEFLRLWFLDLHHQVGAPGLFAGHNLGPRCCESFVGNAGPVAGAGLDPHLQSVAHQFPHSIRGESHPLLIGLDFPRNADAGHRCR